jgi:hypothetical protein
MVGLPLVAQADGFPHKKETDDIAPSWYRSPVGWEPESSTVEGWEPVKEQAWTYTPTDSDVGRYLQAAVKLPKIAKKLSHDAEVALGKASSVANDEETDQDGFVTVEITSNLAVQHLAEELADADQCFWLERPVVSVHGETLPAPKDADSFRVASYNVLADKYADGDWQFPYCTKAAIEAGYRSQLTLRELDFLAADVIAVQEMEFWRDSSLFTPYMTEKRVEGGRGGEEGGEEGYTCLFRSKGGRTEGCAMYINKARFDLVAQHGSDLNSLSERLVQTKIHDLFSKVGSSEERKIHTPLPVEILKVQLLQFVRWREQRERAWDDHQRDECDQNMQTIQADAEVGC